MILCIVARSKTYSPGPARLAPGDSQRVSRALEVWRSTGRRWSEWLREPTRPLITATWRILELAVDRTALAERVERRTRALFDGGLVEETAALVAAGRRAPLEALRAIGYDEALGWLDGADAPGPAPRGSLSALNDKRPGGSGRAVGSAAVRV